MYVHKIKRGAQYMNIDKNTAYTDPNHIERGRTEKNSSDIEKIARTASSNEKSININTAHIEQVEEMLVGEMMDSLYNGRHQMELIDELKERADEIEKNMKTLITSISVGFLAVIISIIYLFI